MEFEIFLQLNKYLLETQQKFTVTHDCFIPHRNKLNTLNSLKDKIGVNNLNTFYIIN